jgi:N-acetylglucosamine-6-phosphate deacetylase
MTRRALIGADVFDGHKTHARSAVVLNDQVFEAVVPVADIPPGAERVQVAAGTLTPGFVDLQVNGGGGVLFNDDMTVDTLITIANAHAGTGTRAILPTLITDTPDKTRTAVDAVERAIRAKVAGIIGIHLEGPHLSVARKGAHDVALIRKMTQDDETFLCNAAQRLTNVMITVAPESVSPYQIQRLSRAGVVVSLGHTDCTMDVAKTAMAAGARCVTHLFNAMSQLGSREPGLVGAMLTTPGVFAGLIADGVHVHPETIRIALLAKQTPGAIFLVTDAMPTVGSDITEFTLGGRRVLRHEGRLTLADGTLAGADLTMPQAISTLVTQVGVTLEDALRMATSCPASLLRQDHGFGRFVPGEAWNGVHLDVAHRVTSPQ